LIECHFSKDKEGKLPTAATGTFYWVRSEAKAAKENGMYDQFTRREGRHDRMDNL